MDGCVPAGIMENGDIYYLGNGSEGYTRSGWYFLESNGKKRPAEGSISKDLVPDSENGKWYYFQSNGKARKGENGVPKEAAIDGRKYYFDENGVMLNRLAVCKRKGRAGRRNRHQPFCISWRKKKMEC